MKTSLNNKKYIYTVGRRKTSSARIRLFKGKGESIVNGLSLSDFVKNSKYKILLEKPLKLTDTIDNFYFTAKVAGGGVVSQISAIVHGISRALIKVSAEKHKSILKKAGLLTRDPRERQRRMAGTGGKARRQKQSPKR
jgi:small subunit ribosomal protein S9